MAVTKSENGRADSIRKLQDEYYAKETQSNKKHKAELRHLTENYQRSVEDLKGDQRQQLDQLNNYMATRLSKQEQEHQRKISEVRDIYSNQIRKKGEESNRLYDAQGQAYESELDKQKLVTANQRERLAREFQLQIKEKDATLTDFIKSSKEETGQLWEQRKAKMEKATSGSLESQRKGLNEQISNLHRQIGEIERTHDSEDKRVVAQNMSEKERMKTGFIQAMARQEDANRRNFEAKADDFKNVQFLAKEKFITALDENQKKLNQANVDFKKNISERTDSQISGLRNELVGVKYQTGIDHTNLLRQNAIEKQHLVEDYEASLKSYRGQREVAIDTANDKIQGEVVKATTSRDKMIKTLSEANARDKDLTKNKNLSQVNQLKTDMQERELHITGRAESRVSKANENLRQSEKRMSKFYEMNLDLIKSGFVTELNNERMRNVQERANIENRLGTKIREQEKLMNHNLETKVAGYEEKISSMKDFYENEMRKQAAQNSKLLNEREMYYKTMVQSQDMRNENQINQLKETHNNELESYEKRHREELNSLAQKISEKNRKKG